MRCLVAGEWDKGADHQACAAAWRTLARQLGQTLASGLMGWDGQATNSIMTALEQAQTAQRYATAHDLLAQAADADTISAITGALLEEGLEADQAVACARDVTDQKGRSC